MPKGGTLDRCHDHVKKSLEEQGMDPKEADGKAWGICKKEVKEEKKTVHKEYGSKKGKS